VAAPSRCKFLRKLQVWTIKRCRPKVPEIRAELDDAEKPPLTRRRWLFAVRRAHLCDNAASSPRDSLFDMRLVCNQTTQDFGVTNLCQCVLLTPAHPPNPKKSFIQVLSE
jgi:hypothetical protein